MAKAHSTWTVLRHGPLQRLSDNLWRVQGALPGMTLERVMTVVRRGDGSLLVHSPIALAEPQLSELDALGPVAVIVVPNAGHRLDAPAYKQRYPQALVFAPPGGRQRIEEVLPVDRAYPDYVDDGVVRFEVLDGVDEAEGALVVRSTDGLTVVLNDVVMNMNTKKDLLGYLFTTVMGSAPGPRVSRLVRWVYVKDQAALRAHLERLAELPQLVRLIVSHENLAEGPDAAAALRQAASYLKSR
jgi:hypothetical protein